LGLPPPHLDDGDVVWSVPDGDISRCFRQMSLRVHPDKNCSPQAAVAFRGEEAPELALASLWARICPAWVDRSAAWFVLCRRLYGSLTVGLRGRRGWAALADALEALQDEIQRDKCLQRVRRLRRCSL
jgi:hypothetical protein